MSEVFDFFFNLVGSAPGWLVVILVIAVIIIAYLMNAPKWWTARTSFTNAKTKQALEAEVRKVQETVNLRAEVNNLLKTHLVDQSRIGELERTLDVMYRLIKQMGANQKVFLDFLTESASAESQEKFDDLIPTLHDVDFTELETLISQK